jgi:hypothetical protein
MMTQTIQSVLIFGQMFRRDLYALRKQIGKLVFNSVILTPFIYIFSYAYIQANIFFGPGSHMTGSSILAGLPLMLLLIWSYNFTVPLIFDIEGDAFINYQITVLNPRLVLFERILFSGLLTFLLIAPFYPVAKLMLGTYFYTDAVSWPYVYLFLLLGSFLVCAYHLCLVCSLSSSRLIVRIWSRCNDPLLIFGGYWIPWNIVNKFSPALGRVTLLNPFLYLTEGLRQAFFHDPKFFSLSTCLIALVLFSTLFTAIAMYFFRKRMDHI